MTSLMIRCDEVHLLQQLIEFERHIARGKVLHIPAILTVELLQPVEPFEKANRPLAKGTIAVIEDNSFAGCRVRRTGWNRFNTGHNSDFLRFSRTRDYL